MLDQIPMNKKRPPSLANKVAPDFAALSPADLEAMSMTLELIRLRRFSPAEAIEESVDDLAILYRHIFVLLRHELRTGA